MPADSRPPGGITFGSSFKQRSAQGPSSAPSIKALSASDGISPLRFAIPRLPPGAFIATGSPPCGSRSPGFRQGLLLGRDLPPAVRDPPASAGGFYSDGLCGRDIDVCRVPQSFQELLAVFPCEAERPNVRCPESSDDGRQISGVWLRERLLHDRRLGPVDERLQGEFIGLPWKS